MNEYRNKEHDNLHNMVYRELEDMEHTLNSRPPATPASARIFMRNVEKVVFYYIALPPSWRKNNPFDTETLLRRACVHYDAVRSDV